MNKAKDFLGEEIFVSDLVIYSQLGYRCFKIGKIIKVTPKCVFISGDIHSNEIPRKLYQVRQEHQQVIKMKDQGYDGYSPF